MYQRVAELQVIFPLAIGARVLFTQSYIPAAAMVRMKVNLLTAKSRSLTVNVVLAGVRHFRRDARCFGVGSLKRRFGWLRERDGRSRD